MKIFFLSFFILFLFCFSQAQSQLHRKWTLMSIDNLSNGVVKQIGEYVVAELIFDTDTTYKGEFCNKYTGKVNFKADKSCKMTEPKHIKRQCMGFSDVEEELFRLYPLVTRYVLKNHLMYLFTSEQKRLVFKSE